VVSCNLIAAASLICAAQTELMGGRQGAGYRLQLPGSGGIPPYKWTVINGQLPPGLNLNERTGMLHADVLTKAGDYRFILQLTDTGATKPVVEVVRLRVSPPVSGLEPLRIITENLPAAIVGKAFSLTIAVRGGAAPITCTIAGSIPAGLSLDSKRCLISGTPKAKGSSKFMLVVQDSQQTPARVSRELGLTIVGQGVAWWWVVLATLGTVIAFSRWRQWRLKNTCPIRIAANRRCGKPIRYTGPNKFHCPVHGNKTWVLT